MRNAVPPSGGGGGPDEAALLARARAGDRGAFGSLIELHQDRVFGLAFRLCKGDRHQAEELAQEGFLRALQGVAGFRGDAAFGTWIHRIVLNLHLNRASSLAARAERGQLSLSAARDPEDAPRLELAAPSPRPDELAAADEEMTRLRAAFDALEESRRVVVLLRDVEGRSYEEIAAALDLPIGTVRSRLARARDELSRELGGSRLRGPEEGAA